MSTVREHLGLLWLLRRKLATPNPQYDEHWAMQAALFVGVHLDELIAIAGGADVEDSMRKHFTEIPAEFPMAAASKDEQYDATLTLLRNLVDYQHQKIVELESQDVKDAERRKAIINAIKHHNCIWPSELYSGVMFFEGQRITRDEFNAAIAASKDAKGGSHD